DADGDPSSATLTITITGSNDGPTLSLVATDSLAEEAGLSSGSAAAGAAACNRAGYDRGAVAPVVISLRRR
ncbi:VCBS domain-containing protein, partial [Pseudomonas sp. FIP_A4]|uniref:VCBS domain-containing protein n=1 Tax=Pseudomonas sp. FIP_A4 TaxID=3070684 RepID=UPI002FCF8F1B